MPTRPAPALTLVPLPSLGAWAHAALAVVALAAWACGGELDAASDTLEAVGAEARVDPRTFRCGMLELPMARAILLYDGREAARGITASGALRQNAAWAEEGVGELAVESQRTGYAVVAGGMVATGTEAEALLDGGLRALEWGLAQQGADGSFPEERGGSAAKNHALHAKSEFLEATARAILLVTTCPGAPSAFVTRAHAMVAPLGRSAAWLAGAQDLVDFRARAQNTNQLFFVATALREAGLLTGAAQLSAVAAAIVADDILPRQLDGVFPEAGGFDTSYQLVSLELLSHYTSTFDEGRARRPLLAAAAAGMARFLRQVDVRGHIDTTGNTRTAACGAPVPGLGPKGKDIDITPYRVLQYGHLAGELLALELVAHRILKVGQGFDHIEDCAGP